LDQTGSVIFPEPIKNRQNLAVFYFWCFITDIWLSNVVAASLRFDWRFG
jgi:hypothetical protein